jgi:hypothetical protein
MKVSPNRLKRLKLIVVVAEAFFLLKKKMVFEWWAV